MGIVFLDEHDCVRFDPSPAGETARRAEINRGILKLTTIAADLVVAVERASKLAGAVPQRNLADDFATLSLIRRQVFDRAERREQASPS
ncbi:MAG: hypothetical protein Q8K99_00410 [Actinomycetota bacterium]|nr:hypothetical protein [Actinomycetota bacterium]